MKLGLTWMIKNKVKFFLAFALIDQLDPSLRIFAYTVKSKTIIDKSTIDTNIARNILVNLK